MTLLFESGNKKSKSCKVCGKQIPHTAEKCVKCGSFQGSLRHVQRCSPLLSSIAAAIPIGIALWALIKFVLFQMSPTLTAHIGHCSAEKIDLVVMNAGAVDGAILTGTIVHQPAQGTLLQAELRFLQYEEQTDTCNRCQQHPVIIGSRSSMVLAVVPVADGGVIGTFHPYTGAGECNLQFAGIDNNFEVDCTCLQHA